MTRPWKRPRRSLRIAALRASHENPSPISTLPTELLANILSFNAPKSESYYRWTWMDRMSKVCLHWSAVADLFFKPQHLYLDFIYYHDLEKEHLLYEFATHEQIDELSIEDRVPFLESFLTESSKSAGVEFIMLNNGMPYDIGAVENVAVQALVRRIFCTPGVFSDLSKLAILCIDHLSSETIAFPWIDSGTTLKRIAMAHPKLDYIYLDGCFPWALKISPMQWKFVCSHLDLDTLILGGATFLTDAHLEACAEHLEKLNFLCLDSCGTRRPNGRFHITDSGLISLSKHCTSLKHLALKTMHNITENGLEALLRANPNITGLDLESSHSMSIQASTIIRKYAQKLTHIKVLHSDWFTDEALNELVVGDIQRQTKLTGTSDLVLLNIRGTQVSPSGLRQVLASNVLKSIAAIDIGYSSEDLRDATLMRPGLKYAILAQLVDAEDLDVIRSTVEARKAEWLCLSQDYGIEFSTKAGQ